MADFSAPFTGGRRPGNPRNLGRPTLGLIAGRGGATTARVISRGGGLIQVVAELDVQGTLRDAQGRYLTTQDSVREGHEQAARALQELTANTMQNGLRRPGVSSLRLFNALMDPRNIFVSKEGYGVGRPEFLDQSQAKYWRQIDQGFAGHVGRTIVGVWGATLTGAYRTPRSGGTPYPVAGPAYSGFGEGGRMGDRLIPMGRSQAYRFLRTANGRNIEGRAAATRGIIRRPIKAQRYFRAGWRAFNARQVTTAYVEQAISRSFGGRGVPTTAMARFQAGRGPLPSPSRQFRAARSL